MLVYVKKKLTHHFRSYDQYYLRKCDFFRKSYQFLTFFPKFFSFLWHYLQIRISTTKVTYLCNFWQSKRIKVATTRKDLTLANVHWENYISISFHLEWDMIVVTIFFSILNQMQFHLVQNRKENCHHDHIPFNLKGNVIKVFSA